MAEDEDLGTDPAAAFEALRAEVAALRASVEQGRDGPAAPDYAPTLGKIAATLAAMEVHPALALAPEAFASQVGRAREAAQQQGGRELANAVQRVDAADVKLERLAERLRTGREQVRRGYHDRRGRRPWRRRVGVLLRADRPCAPRWLERARADSGGDLRLDRGDAG